MTISQEAEMAAVFAISLILGNFVWVTEACDARYPYRTFNGACNNLRNREWGSTQSQFRRLLPAEYEGDGDTLRGEGRTPPLPLPRTLSYTLSNNLLASTPPSGVTLMAMTWGQFISHDTMLSKGTSTANCGCSNGVMTTPSSDPNCCPINVIDDPFYSNFSVECLSFSRQEDAIPSLDAREQINTVTSYIDASTVYGISTKSANNLRSFCFGKLKIGPEAEINESDCAVTCPLTFPPTEINNNRSNFLTGDPVRSQQHPALTSVHIFFVRVHNDIAQRLAFKRPRWSDEILYQETRKIVTALIQHITYNEYLPAILGETAMNQFDIAVDGRWYGEYDRNVDATLSNVFSGAAYRFGHSLVANTFELSSGNNVLLAESFGSHDITLTPGTYPSDFLGGLSLQESSKMDQVLVDAIRNKLFAPSPFEQGSDLYSINIKRGRDRGIPPYNKWRKFCGLSEFQNFSDMVSHIPDQIIQIFSQTYAFVDDIDLYPAGLAEISKSDGILGPTFTCLLGEQFKRLRYGDRFFYDNRNQPDKFNIRQLRAIRETTLKSLICSYTQVKEQIPDNVMKVMQPGDTITDCSSIREGQIPEIILDRW